MKRASLLLLLVVMLPAGCGSSEHARLTVRPYHASQRLLTGCFSNDCGPYAATFNWAAVSIASQTGYFVYQDGVQIADVASGPYVFHGLDCGVTFTFGVAAHDGSGGTSTISSVSYSSPSCGSAFDDEFNGASLDASLWTAADVHGDSKDGGTEQQCYRPANITETGGAGVETAQSQSVTCVDSIASSFTSGELNQKAFSFQYGTVEASVEMAGGAGTWPTFFTLGSQCQRPMRLANGCAWPNGGSEEVDIAEVQNNGGASSNVGNSLHSSAISGTVHTCANTVATNHSAFHTYKLVWTSASMQWFIDGTQTCAVAASSCSGLTGCVVDTVPSSPEYVVLNTAVGSAGGNTISGLPQTTSVDYVRVTTNSPVNTVLPTLSTGSPAHGSAVSVNSTGTWTNNTSPTFTYQWQDCATGFVEFSCANITGATSSSYTPVASGNPCNLPAVCPNGDVGDKLQVVVTSTTSTGGAAATTAQTTNAVS